MEAASLKGERREEGGGAGQQRPRDSELFNFVKSSSQALTTKLATLGVVVFLYTLAYRSRQHILTLQHHILAEAASINSCHTGCTISVP